MTGKFNPVRCISGIESRTKYEENKYKNVLVKTGRRVNRLER